MPDEAPAPPHTDSAPIPLDVLASIDQRFADGDRRMQSIEEAQQAMHLELQANTAATNANGAATAEMLEWFRAGQGAFRVLEGLGKLAKPMTYIVGFGTACASAWALFRSGGRP